MYSVGMSEMLHQLSMNVKLPTSSNATQQFIDFIYLTQVGYLLTDGTFIKVTCTFWIMYICDTFCIINFRCQLK